jgi:hypothetical protein
MSIPIESKTFTYTPPSLTGENPASFTFRFGTRRDRNNMADQKALRRLRRHFVDDYQRAVLSEIKLDWRGSPEELDSIVYLIERYYAEKSAFEEQYLEHAKECLAILDGLDADMSDEEKRNHLPEAPNFDFDAEETRRVEFVISEIENQSLLIGSMDRDNRQHERGEKLLAIAILLESTTLDLELKRDRSGLLEDDCVIAIEDELERLTDGPQAYFELATEARNAFKLTAEQEKNSASPSPITTDPNSSTSQEQTVSTTTTSASKASAKAPTPENLQPSMTETSSNSPSPVETHTAESDGQMVDASLISQ